MKKLGFLIIGFFILFDYSGIVGATDDSAPWFDNGYGYRQQITINNPAASNIEDGYTLKTSLDHASLVSMGKSLASGDDIRVVYWNGASNVELDRISENWNSTNTEILFKAQSSINAGESNSNYYLYYGNTNPKNPLANPNNVYYLFEDFDGAIGQFPTGWTNTLVGTMYAELTGDGRVKIGETGNSGQHGPPNAGISKSLPFENARIKVRWEEPDSQNEDKWGLVYRRRGKETVLLWKERNAWREFPGYLRKSGFPTAVVPFGENIVRDVELIVYENSLIRILVDEIEYPGFDLDSGYAEPEDTAFFLGIDSLYSGDAWYWIHQVKISKFINPEPATILGLEDTHQIWSCNGTLTNAGETQITSDAGWDYDPSFSPDGSKILFTYVAPKGGDTDIIVMNADGTNRVQLTNDPDSTDDDYPAWSPDGSKIVYSTGVYGVYRNRNIFVMNADGSEKTCLTCQEDGNWRNPKFSPDGSKILYLNHVGPYVTDIWVMNADGSGKVLLVGGSNYFFPSWSPDGSRILFTQGPGAYGDIWVMNADGSNQIQLTNTPWNEGVPVFSPDGKRIGYQSEKSGAGNWDIWVMNADGSEQTPLTDYPTIEGNGHGGTLWSPDGSKLLFLSNRMGTYDLFVMTLGCEGLPTTTCGGTPAPWWDFDYKYREKITVNNPASSGLEEGYTANTNIDHSTLVSTGKALESGSDVRIVYWDGTSNAEIDRISDNWNSANTEILFKTQASIPSDGSDSNYYIYYGNPSAGSPPADRNNVYLFYDDFENGLGKWTYTHDVSIETSGANSYANLEAPASCGTQGRGFGGYRWIETAQNISLGSDYEISYREISNSYSGNLQSCTGLYPYFQKPVTPTLSYVFEEPHYSVIDADCDIGGSYSDAIGISGNYVSRFVWRHSAGLWRNFTIRKVGGDISYNADGLTLATAMDPAPLTNDGSLRMIGVCGASAPLHRHIDDVTVRKYISTEPTTVSCTEESREDITPTTIISLSGRRGNNDWYISNVEVTLTAADNEGGSGIVKTEYSLDGTTWNTYTAPFTISAEGTTTVYYRSFDAAGNIETTKEQVINIDKTMPSVTITSPEAKDYLHSESITISFDSADALSGIDSTIASIDGVHVADGEVLDLRTLTLGQHTLTVEVSDKAGNTESESVTFNINPLSATVDVKPDTLNKDSQSDKNAVTVYIEIPGFDVNAIDPGTVTLRTSKGSIHAQLTPTEVGDYDKDGTPDRMVKFDRQAVIDIVDVGDSVEITITGRVAGAIFEGSDTIRVINKGK